MRSTVLLFAGLLAACTANEVSSSESTAALTDCVPDATGRQIDLRCTGFDAKGVEPFTPGFELWSDGAHKSRFIYLPPGTAIDTTDMNSWKFPVGTKFWKEFKLPVDGAPQRVETRFMEKVSETKWNLATYVWSGDTATLLDTGIPSVPGTNGYEIPSLRTCNRCHNGRADHVLGFEAMLLAAPEASGLTYDRLVERGLVHSKLPSTALQVPGNPVERSAIGLLHANCGIGCHHEGGPGPFSMRLEIGNQGAPQSVDQTSVFNEAINQESGFAPDGTQGTVYRIRPTDEQASMIFYRMSKRDAPGGFEQMPPVATHKPDAEMIEVMRTWIRSMTSAPYPQPL